MEQRAVYTATNDPLRKLLQKLIPDRYGFDRVSRETVAARQPDRGRPAIRDRFPRRREPVGADDDHDVQGFEDCPPHHGVCGDVGVRVLHGFHFI